MIAFCQPLPIGNAVRLLLAPAAGASKTRLLRKTSDDISGADDDDAAVIYEGDERLVIDTTALVNGTPYFYRAFDRVGAAWVASASVSATPAMGATMTGPDPLEVVRSRLAQGLKAEVVAGRLSHVDGAIPVFTAPPAADNIRWPVFTCHLKNASPFARGIGELVHGAVFDEDEGDWIEGEGWLDQVTIEVIAWSLNPDERIELRKTVEKIIVGNLPIFAAAGFDEVGLQLSDVEDMEGYTAPVYQALATITAIAPAVVDARTFAIEDVEVEANVSQAA